VVVLLLELLSLHLVEVLVQLLIKAWALLGGGAFSGRKHWGKSRHLLSLEEVSLDLVVVLASGVILVKPLEEHLNIFVALAGLVNLWLEGALLLLFQPLNVLCDLQVLGLVILRQLLNQPILPRPSYLLSLGDASVRQRTHEAEALV